MNYRVPRLRGVVSVKVSTTPSRSVVFPAYAGLFPPSILDSALAQSVPRLRGIRPCVSP